MASAPNPLQEYPQIRQWIYRAFWVIGLALGGVQTWFATTGGDFPSWLAPALAVMAYLSIATNYTADRNVNTTQEEPMAKLAAVPDPFSKDNPPLGPVDDEHSYERDARDERGAWDTPSLLIALAAIVVIVVGVVWLVQTL